jgi:hypothetical protein
MMAEMAQALAKTSDAATYSRLFTNICSAFQTNFVAADGTVGSGSQGGYALALAFNLLTPAQRSLATNKMAAAVDAQGGNPSTGMVTTHLLLPALTSIGCNDLAYQMLEKTNYPSWGFEVGVGATTFFELWNSVNADGTVNISQDGMNSFNHANFGTCAEWFYRDILGIDLLQPGFREINIAPQVGGGLTSAQVFYDSIQGPISNAWTYTGNTFTMKVAIPPNTTAQICVPTTNASAITEGGVPAASSPDVAYIGVSNGAAIYTVGSGSYLFSSPFSIPAAPTPPPFTVNNNSFEGNVASGSGQVAQGTPIGWTSFNQVATGDIGSQWAGGADFTDPLVAPANGNQYCYVNLYNNPNPSTGIYQDVGALQPNTDYTLTVAIGNRADRQELPGIISLINGVNNTGTVLASDYGVPATQNTWQDFATGFTTGASVSGDLTIELSVDPTVTGDGNGGSVQAAFDNVQLTATPIILKMPTLGASAVSSGNLILTGSNGTPNSGYTLLTATNLLAPIYWATNSTGTLDGTGALSNSIPTTFTSPASFFRLRIP